MRTAIALMALAFAAPAAAHNDAPAELEFTDAWEVATMRDIWKDGLVPMPGCHLPRRPLMRPRSFVPELMKSVEDM